MLKEKFSFLSSKDKQNFFFCFFLPEVTEEVAGEKERERERKRERERSNALGKGDCFMEGPRKKKSHTYFASTGFFCCFFWLRFILAKSLDFFERANGFELSG